MHNTTNMDQTIWHRFQALGWFKMAFGSGDSHGDFEYPTLNWWIFGFKAGHLSIPSGVNYHS